jgi:hypothetical protein
MLKKSLLVLAAIFTIASAAAAQAHANFNGKWALSHGRSDFGSGDPLAQRIDTITVDGNHFSDVIHASGKEGDDDYTIDLTTDGKEAAVPDNSPLSINGILTMTKIAARWKGNTLVLTETFTNTYSPGENKSTVTYSLSPDGSLLSITSKSDNPFGLANTRLVFEKL